MESDSAAAAAAPSVPFRIAEADDIDLDDDAEMQTEARLEASASQAPTSLLMLGTDNHHDTGDTVTYKLSSSAVHPSGALLLESRFQTLLDANLNFRGAARVWSNQGCSGQAGLAETFRLLATFLSHT